MFSAILYNLKIATRYCYVLVSKLQTRRLDPGPMRPSARTGPGTRSSRARAAGGPVAVGPRQPFRVRALSLDSTTEYPRPGGHCQCHGPGVAAQAGSLSGGQRARLSCHRYGGRRLPGVRV